MARLANDSKMFYSVLPRLFYCCGPHVEVSDKSNKAPDTEPKLDGGLFSHAAAANLTAKTPSTTRLANASKVFYCIANNINSILSCKLCYIVLQHYPTAVQ